ncbi:SDR family NAD(P)-dependent oxidoreductase [Streptomyces sp. NBC_00385]|uniref:SDR family NAD(P)-dependent oxidoreductase n=1 Tax=Streptomyces sp. NBC_00385 TaxID=2975733 RepID=UPI002DD96F25|nr:SDR family NAD(P)-dependent oxidoreductase [Streptomyces sp. NBC_00385]WRZ05539.1 SDR family oxidoreductase [Streptomyces sp. NBC_00385]
MDLHLTGKTILITGATSGIGRATAQLLADEGAQVVAVARSDAELPIDVDLFLGDLSEPATAQRAVDHVLARHGRIDGLVNNAGSLISRDSFEAIDDAQWYSTFELNLHAAVRVTRAALPLLRGNPDGAAVVHVASEAARLPDASIADYAASKAALLSVSKALATSLGPSGVRSDVVSPGPTRTALFDASGGFADRLATRYGLPREQAVDRFIRTERRLPTGRIGTPQEVAGVIAYLLSPRAHTGHGRGMGHRRRRAAAAVDGLLLRTHGCGRSSPQRLPRRPRKPLRGLIH